MPSFQKVEGGNALLTYIVLHPISVKPNKSQQFHEKIYTIQELNYIICNLCMSFSKRKSQVFFARLEGKHAMYKLNFFFMYITSSKKARHLGNQYLGSQKFKLVNRIYLTAMPIFAFLARMSTTARAQLRATTSEFYKRQHTLFFLKSTVKSVCFVCFELRAGSCKSELQLKVNYRQKVNCMKKFGLACQLLAESAQILSYNSLSAAIHLYMIWD